MHVLSALIFLQIVSESFPVSSSGHVALALFYVAQYMSATYELIAPFFNNDIFMFLLHVPTIAIVILFFRSTWWPLFVMINRRWRLVLKLIFYAMVADSITALIYIGMKLMVPPFFLCAGFIGTMFLLLSLRWAPSGSKKLTLGKAAFLGAAQGVALLPGISRLGTVYVAGRWLGLNPVKAFGVSWMLQFPLMVAAVGISMLKEISCPTIIWSDLSLPVICLATIISYGAFWLADWASRRNLFWFFGIYMVLPIIICLCIYC